MRECEEMQKKHRFASTRQQQAVSTTYIIRVLDTKKSLPKNKDQKSLVSLSYLTFPIRLQLLLSTGPISKVPI